MLEYWDYGIMGLAKWDLVSGKNYLHMHLQVLTHENFTCNPPAADQYAPIHYSRGGSYRAAPKNLIILNYSTFEFHVEVAPSHDIPSLNNIFFAASPRRDLSPRTSTALGRELGPNGGSLEVLGASRLAESMPLPEDGIALETMKPETRVNESWDFGNVKLD